MRSGGTTSSSGGPVRRRLDDTAAPALCPLEPDDDGVLVPVIDNWLEGAACILEEGGDPVTVTDVACVAQAAEADGDGAAVFAPHPALAASLVWNRCTGRWYVGCATNDTALLAAGVSVAVGLGAAGASAVGDLPRTAYPPEGEVCVDGDGGAFCPVEDGAGGGAAAGDLNGDGVRNVNDVVLLVHEIFEHNEEVMGGGGAAD